MSNCCDGFYIQDSLLGVRVNCLLGTGAHRPIIHQKKYFSISDSCMRKLQPLVYHFHLANSDKVQTLVQAEIPLDFSRVGVIAK